MFSRLVDFTPVIELLQRLPLANVTRIVFRLCKSREWMSDDALQPLQTVGVLLARAAKPERVVMVWDTESLPLVPILDGEIKEVETRMRLALRSLDERRKGMVKWRANEPKSSLL